jgi:hypothetical protein
MRQNPIRLFSGYFRGPFESRSAPKKDRAVCPLHSHIKRALEQRNEGLDIVGAKNAADSFGADVGIADRKPGRIGRRVAVEKLDCFDQRSAGKLQSRPPPAETLRHFGRSDRANRGHRRDLELDERKHASIEGGERGYRRGGSRCRLLQGDRAMRHDDFDRRGFSPDRECCADSSDLNPGGDDDERCRRIALHREMSFASEKDNPAERGIELNGNPSAFLELGNRTIGERLAVRRQNPGDRRRRDCVRRRRAAECDDRNNGQAGNRKRADEYAAGTTAAGGQFSKVSFEQRCVPADSGTLEHPPSGLLKAENLAMARVGRKPGFKLAFIDRRQAGLAPRDPA